MFVLEYVTERENGETVLNRLECETWAQAHLLMEQAQCSPDGYPMPHINHSFRIEELS